MGNIGIYKIYFIQKPAAIYIGSTIDFKLRKIRHRYQLKKNIHKNPYLQRSYNKYGKQNMVFELLETIKNKKGLIEREQYYIDILKPKINILKVAGSALGYKHTYETKKFLSKINKGKKMSKEQNERNSIAQTGNKNALGSKRNIEQRKHLSELKKRKVINEKTGEIFDCIESASQRLKMKYQTLYAKLSGKNINNTDMRFL